MSFESQDDLYMPCLLKPAGCQGQRVQLPVGCMVQYPPGMPNSVQPLSVHPSVCQGVILRGTIPFKTQTVVLNTRNSRTGQ